VTGFFFNYFTAALLTLLVLGVIATWVAVKGYRQADEEGASKMATLLVAVCFSAVASVGFLTLFILSTALPLYTRLTDR
jgi:dolichyl-phosphate-mannose--protein O-mannosyl transferase